MTLSVQKSARLILQPSSKSILYFSSAVSTVGNQANVLAVSYFIKETTESPLMLSSIMGVAGLVGALGATIGGYVGSAFHKKWTLVSLNALAAATSLFMAFAAFQPGNWSVMGVAVGFVFLAAIAQVQTPIFRAVLFALIERNKLLATNGRVFSLNQILSIAGQSACTALYALIKPAGLLVLDGISYILAALSFGLLPNDKRLAKQDSQAIFLRKEVFDFSPLKDRRSLARDLLYLCMVNFFIAPLVVYLPFVTKSGGQELGYYYIAISCGAALGGLAASRLSKLPIGLIVCLVGLSRIGLGLVHGWVLICTFTFVESMLAGILSIRMITKIQLETEPEMQTRIMGLVGTVLAPVVPLGFFMGGILIEYWPRDSGFMMSLTGSAIAILGLVPLLTKKGGLT